MDAMSVDTSKFFIAKDRVEEFREVLIEHYNVTEQDLSVMRIVNRYTEWSVSVDDDGNIDDLYYIEGKWNWEDDLIELIAPFAEDGSHVELVDDGGYGWQYYFHNGKVKEYGGHLEFPDSPIRDPRFDY